MSVVDLPGAYSLTPATPDEQVTLEVIEGRRHGEAAPDAIIAVVDATNLRMNLRLVLELQAPRPAGDGGPQHGRRGARPRPRHRRARSSPPSSAARWSRPWRCAPTGMPPCWRLMEARLGGRPCPMRWRRPGRPHFAASNVATDEAPSSNESAAARCKPHPGHRRARCRRIDEALPPQASTMSSCTRCGAWCCSACHAVSDVPGGVLLGQPAHGRDQERDGRARPRGVDRAHEPKARCAACWSTA